MPRNDLMKLLVTIVDRGKGGVAVDLYRSHRLHFDYLCMGFGTANSQILDYFGLDATEKDVVLTLVPAWRARKLIDKMDERFGLSRPGRGIVFTIPLSGVSGRVHQVLFKDEQANEEEMSMETAIKYDLILVVVNSGIGGYFKKTGQLRGGRRSAFRTFVPPEEGEFSCCYKKVRAPS